jgi:hypothetical protein
MSLHAGTFWKMEKEERWVMGRRRRGEGRMVFIYFQSR